MVSVQKSPGTSTLTLTTQIDVAPTVLGLLGLPYSAPFFGQDVRHAPAKDRVAFFSHNHDVAIYRDGALAILGLKKSVKNMRYDAAVRLGVDYESLKAIKPDLIYCHTRGHERGPRERLPGNDQTGACLAGVQYEDGGMADGGGAPAVERVRIGN